MNTKLKNKIARIKVLAMDVDGVLTDGKLVYDGLGGELKMFDVHDGLGLALLRKAGLRTAIISAKSSDCVKIRARHLGIDKVFLNAFPKGRAFLKLLKDFNALPHEVCFMGDDLTDLIILKQVGLAVAVANAVAEVKAQADYITRCPGGSGAVREVVELILKNHGKWKTLLHRLALGE